MKFAVAALAMYLLLGMAFAMATLPDQMYYCPDPSSPSGEVGYGGLDAPPRPDCHATVTNGDRAQWIAFATPTWLPLIVAKGLSND
ncbi:hypothetical protein [Nocardioides perillae]|uniref:Secreted protein n=1 Tax=Nocardioides perillae TaxID=1119534 RepID=A0A7Y9RYH3_9ACTN|nr:hypothetical protein [Nocardioides perillae]NYG56439.1 hypothetical protein [Nocardioides perillae]